MSGAAMRKVRLDKKKDVQPTVSHELKDTVYRLSYILERPVKDVSEQIIKQGMMNKKIISEISARFRRPIQLENTLYMGDIMNESNRRRSIPGVNGRITIRFNQSDHEKLVTLAYGLDCSTARAAGIVLENTIMFPGFIESYLLGFEYDRLDERRIAELKKVAKYISRNDEKIWLTLLKNLFKI